MRTFKFKTICVFCSSNLEKKKSYQDVAIDLGKELVIKNINLVYGGGNIGLIGLISQTVFKAIRFLLSIIPKTLMDKEITSVSIGEVKPITDMHQRKAEITSNYDVFIVMLGGYGTLKELFEVITWAQLDIHNKLVGLFDIYNYYNSHCFLSLTKL
ncbi:Cytokinin riboside 5'-monophosphate phosphoribohydrolase LOG protein [Dioscorea alata]|uniref:Cytokinin riboside 5'-monophosphate phosphoribohydrolase LOG protein n=1 Tax=Dioscorea alata TaxID=55571 RepID=A0ACB7UXN4_DIOAL|nr:Cytokinin riboside 5'-monophosphate phosphoribohydrolase LOG protein [Dioscorea alata]